MVNSVDPVHALQNAASDLDLLGLVTMSVQILGVNMVGDFRRLEQ